MGAGRGLQIGPCVILTMQDDNPQRLNATRFAIFCACSSPCGCAPRCPCPWQVKIERLIVHKRALCAVRTSLLSTYNPVASFRGAGIDRYRSGMPRVGAARSLFIFIPWAPPLRSVGRGAGRGLAECIIIVAAYMRCAVIRRGPRRRIAQMPEKQD